MTEDDIEPVNWIQAEHAARLSAVDYAAALAAVVRVPARRAGVVGGRLGPAADADARRAAAALAEFDPVPGDPSAQMRRAGRWIAFTPAFNMSGQPAISLPLHWNDAGLPIGGRSSPPTAARTSPWPTAAR